MSQAHQIRRRIDALRIPDKDIAALAGVHKDTLAKMLDGRCDPKISTMEKVRAALAIEERRVLAHLLALHPDLGDHPRASPADEGPADTIPAGPAPFPVTSRVTGPALGRREGPGAGLDYPANGHGGYVTVAEAQAQ